MTKAKAAEHVEDENEPIPPKRARSVPPPAPPAPPAHPVHAIGVEYVTAPEHVLLVKFTGEEQDLIRLKQAVLRSLARVEGEPVTGPPELPGELREVLGQLPR
jgi:hypothetical protein